MAARMHHPACLPQPHALLVAGSAHPVAVRCVRRVGRRSPQEGPPQRQPAPSCRLGSLRAEAAHAALLLLLPV
jgi:hypothetical protein